MRPASFPFPTLPYLPSPLLSAPDQILHSMHQVHGFDRTSFNGANPSHPPGRDVWRVSGTFAGWSASDLTAPVSDVARFGYDLHGRHGPRLLSTASQRRMVPSGEGWYGFATFNLSGMGISGQSSAGPYAVVYGHLGATYGYDSLLAYYPAIDVSIAVATNIETDEQTAPSEIACLAYNVVLAAFTRKQPPKCTFAKRGFYGGVCDCGNNFYCSPWERKCVRSVEGTLSRADCETVC